MLHPEHDGPWVQAVANRDRFIVLLAKADEVDDADSVVVLCCDDFSFDEDSAELLEQVRVAVPQVAVGSSLESCLCT